MTNLVTCTLVATVDRVRRDFPKQMERRFNSGVVSAQYKVDLSRLNSKFAVFLARNISTTRPDDDGSRVSLAYPESRFEQLVKNWLTTGAPVIASRFPNLLAAAGGPEALIDALRAAAEGLQDILDMYGAEQFEGMRVEEFAWPVFGSHACPADTPEAYFEHCAGRIWPLGAVPLEVGLNRARPEDSLLRTFAQGKGLAVGTVYRLERDKEPNLSSHERLEFKSALQGAGLSHAALTNDSPRIPRAAE